MFMVKIEDIIDNVYEFLVDNKNRDISILEEDIKINGIKKPLDVLFLHRVNKYLIIHGHHRFLIAKRLGLIEIPCENATIELLAFYISSAIINKPNKKELDDLVKKAVWNNFNMQTFQEIEVLVNRIINNGELCAVLEIGVANGGTLKIWESMLPQNKYSLLIGVDTNPNPYWDITKSMVDVQLVKGNSHDINTWNKVKEILRGRKVDFLFIDAEHWNDAVKQDFIDYGAFVRDYGIIALHDTLFFHSFWDKLTWDRHYKDDNIPFHIANKEGLKRIFQKEEIKYEYGIGIFYKLPNQNIIKFRDI